MKIDEFLVPARAAKVIKPLDLPSFVSDAEEEWFAEEKLDGSRYLLYIGKNECKLLSRNWSVQTGEPVDKTLNVPHIALGYGPELAGTVLDGEIQAGTKSSSTTRIMGCSPDKAVERQRKEGWVQFHVFDCLQYREEDLRELPWEDRDSHRQMVLKKMMNQHLLYVPAIPLKSAVQRYNTIIQHGGEGLILKRKDSVYGESWTKVKKLITIDVVVTGYVPGQGKYSGQIGAIKFGMYDGPALVEMGQCSGMTDAERITITSNRDKLKGTVIEVMGQEFTSDGRLRHPRFLRLRPDKNPKMCKWDEQINVLGALIGGGQ